MFSTLEFFDNVLVAIRPESINIHQEKVDNSIQARINKISYVGNHYQYTITSPIGDLYVVSGNTFTNYKLNENIFITFKNNGLNILSD